MNRCQGDAQCVPLAPTVGEEALQYDPNPDDSLNQQVLPAAPPARYRQSSSTGWMRRDRKHKNCGACSGPGNGVDELIEERFHFQTGADFRLRSSWCSFVGT